MSVQTKEKILKAAEKEFSRRGFHGTQISHIIQTAGVARGTFYLYFKSKEEVFQELLKRVVQDIKEKIKPVDPSREVIPQIKQNIANVGEYVLRNKDLARIVLFRSCEPEYARITEEFFEEIVQLVKQTLEKGIEMGILKPINTELIARVIVGGSKEVLKGLITKEKVDVYEVADELIKFGMGGIWNDNGGA